MTFQAVPSRLIYESRKGVKRFHSEQSTGRKDRKSIQETGNEENCHLTNQDQIEAFSTLTALLTFRVPHRSSFSWRISPFSVLMANLSLEPRK